MSTAESPSRVAFETPRGSVTTANVLDRDDRLDTVTETGTLLQVELTESSTLWIPETEAIPVGDMDVNDLLELP